MGSAQSQSADAASSKVVRIDRSDVPEEYRTVGVSSDVVRRVNAQMPNLPPGAGMAADIDVEKLKTELERERREKQRLEHEVVEMRKLTELKQRSEPTVAAMPQAQQILAPVIVRDDIDERKRIFDETVDRVEKQFFNYRRENVCENNEKEIVDCLNANPNRVLKCSHLVTAFEKCVADFRQEVLKGH